MGYFSCTVGLVLLGPLLVTVAITVIMVAAEARGPAHQTEYQYSMYSVSAGRLLKRTQIMYA